jgi:putative ABC transport system permease protein
MFSNTFEIILRNLTRNKSFSFINFIGLITAFTVCLFIAQFVWFECSFERFNNNAERTFRVNLYNTSNGVFENISAGTVSGLAYAMKTTLPGIESIGRISSKATAVVSNPGRQVKNIENRIVYADPSIVDLLAVNLIAGKRYSILRDVQAMIVSESAARKYFENTDIIGESLEIGFPGPNIEMKVFKIAGVFRDIPSNAHQHFDFLLAPASEQAWNENWAWSDVSTYVRLNANTDPEVIRSGLAKIVKQFHQDGKGDKYLLEPITEIRLNALDGSGRGAMVNFFLALGLVVLLLAWFNYISLSTARFFENMKEIGIRKLIGASRKALILKFLAESFIFNVISFVCAILIFALIWPWVATYFQIPEAELILLAPVAYLYLFAALFLSTLMSGLYPSIFLSSFNPLQSIKGKVNEFTDRSSIRKILVVLQLSISLVLITAVFAIKKQIGFLQQQNLGISLEQTLIIESPVLTDQSTIHKYKPFRNEILQSPSVAGVTYASSFPGSEIDWHRADITLNEENAPFRYSSRIVSIGAEFLDVFNLRLLTGRNFNSDNVGDQKAMLINELAAGMFGFEQVDDAIGKLIFVGSRQFEIIGVIENYHFVSLQHKLQPILYMQGYPRNPAYAIRIHQQDMIHTVAAIEQKWKETYPENVFSYYFLDEKFDLQYSSDRQLGILTGVLTALAVVVSFLGLFGLSLYTVSRRKKEIGLRKVFGASVLNIVVLFSKDYAKLVGFGSLIGVPLSYFLINSWLQKYAYQFSLDYSLFTVPVLVLVVLTFGTVSIETTRTANKNPVESLKYE